jgi:hypothetical protein
VDSRLSVVSGDIVQRVDQEICERWRFMILECLCEFRRVPKILTGVHKTQNGFSFDFFRMIPQIWQ